MAPRKKKPTQTEIEATRSDRHKDIDAAADKYRELRDNFREIKEEVDAAKEAMKAVMVKHNLKVYPLEGTDPPEEVVIEVAHEEVKIRKAKGPKSDDAGF
jgi:seryl-tRNA synthetase